MQFVKRSILFISLVFSLANSVFSRADTELLNTGKITEKIEITLAVEDSWPPYANAYGEGISTDLITRALESVGVTLNLKVYPYARVLDEVIKGKVDGGFNVTRQKSREDKFIFGEQPTMVAAASFYFPKNSHAAEKYSSIADIPDGASIGVIIDYEYGDIYDEHRHRFNEIKVPLQSQIIHMLRLNRIDAAVMFDTVASHTLKTLNLSQDSITKSFLNHTSDIYVAFSKSNKDSRKFAKLLDQGLINIKNNGQYLDVIDQWDQKLNK
jgi:polar amino acid transport system substrate-binding protein